MNTTSDSRHSPIAKPCEHRNADFFNGKLSTTNSRGLYIAWCPDCGAARTTLAEDWLLPRRSSSVLEELEALEACVAYMKDDSGGYEVYRAVLDVAEALIGRYREPK